MINKIQSNNTFSSTRIIYNAEDLKKSGVITVMDKYLQPLRERCFDIRSREMNTLQKIANSLKEKQVSVIPSDNGFTIVGHNNEADTFIGRLLTTLFPNEAKFTNDIT